MDNVFDKMYYGRGQLIGGIDESGVCDIAGPLVAACVVLPKIDLKKDDLKIFDVNDSKKIPEKYRKHYAEIIWQSAVGIGIGEVQPFEIDYLGQQIATRLAMLRAVAACRGTANSKKVIVPDYLMVDGDVGLETTISQLTIVRGDSKSLSIAAASIVAKVYRDEIMINLHEKYPVYDWDHNKGFPSDKHLSGLDEHGVVVGVHRTKYWPFAKHPKHQDDLRGWSRRRTRWRRLTERRLGAELGEAVWDSRPRT